RKQRNVHAAFGARGRERLGQVPQRWIAADVRVKSPATHGDGIRVSAIEVETRSNADVSERACARLLQSREWRAGNGIRLDPGPHRAGLDSAREGARPLCRFAKGFRLGRLTLTPAEVKDHGRFERQYGLVHETLMAFDRSSCIAVTIEPERFQLRRA